MTGHTPVDRLDALAALRKASETTFKALGEGCYRMQVPALKASFEIDCLRRDGGQLKGEVLVRCELPGTQARGGVLTTTDLNLSSTRTRATLAKDLCDLAQTKDSAADWRGAVEEFCQRVLAAEREGEPEILLTEAPLPQSERLLYVDGFPLLEKHPLILFGDGGTGKSLLALYFAGCLAHRGHRVGLFDWELDGSEHRLRLQKLFPSSPPKIFYVRCSRPLYYEKERLQRVVKRRDLGFVVFDSISFACDGPPEAAEQANRYFQALRNLGSIGSLHVAHVRRGEGGEHQPFGSQFWANGARSTWNVQPASRDSGDSRLQLALHHRKYNTTGKMHSAGFEILFEPDRIAISSLDLGDAPDLAAQLTLAERVRLALKSGPRSRTALRDEFDDVKEDSLRKIINREKKAGRLLEFPGERLALPEKNRE